MIHPRRVLRQIERKNSKTGTMKGRLWLRLLLFPYLFSEMGKKLYIQGWSCCCCSRHVVLFYLLYDRCDYFESIYTKKRENRMRPCRRYCLSNYESRGACRSRERESESGPSALTWTVCRAASFDSPGETDAGKKSPSTRSPAGQKDTMMRNCCFVERERER